MTQFEFSCKFRRRGLSVILGVLMAPSIFALEVLSDQSLANTTGEGIAILPENFKMVFQGANDASTSSSYNNPSIGYADASKYDTGFIRLIPTGENYSNLTISSTAAKERSTKGDVFIYGLALSKANSDINQRFSNEGFNWGSADNPWLLRAGTAEQISQFKASNKADISYLAIEAPLARVNPTIDNSDGIKLGFWIDAFSRKWESSNEVNPITGAPSVMTDLDEKKRLRLQVVANGLNLSGSEIKVFQTQDSDVAMHKNTLGMANVLRINTNLNPSNLKITDNNLSSKALRVSTATLSSGTGPTPALTVRGQAPTFDPYEGLYLYSPNINLVLGNMYQPFVVGSEGNNIILEVTRIPNVPSIYEQVYTRYAEADPNVSAGRYKGSTCNSAQCGTPFTAANGIAYQGKNATHSSISIGSVTHDPTKNTIRANTARDSTGIVFRGSSVGATPVNLGSASIDGVLIQHMKIKTNGL